MYLDGSSYIKTANSIDLSSGDWTIEMWVYPTAFETDQSIFAGKNDFVSPGMFILSNGTIRYHASSDGESWITFRAAGQIALNLNAWNHIVFERSGEYFVCYINGAQDVKVNVASTINLYKNTVGNVIGVWGNGGMFSTKLYIDELRVSNIARYAAAFTPPTAQFNADANTITLLHFEEAIGYQAKDEILTNVWSSTGLPQPSNQQSKFNKSLFLDGSSSLLLPNDSTKIDLSKSDFTIDWWEYRTAGGGILPTIFECNDTDGSKELDRGLLVRYATPNNNVFASSTGNGWDMLSYFSLGSIDLNTWNHFALVRKGDTFYGFKNGTLTSTAKSSLAIYGLGNIFLGKRNLNNSDGYLYFFKGYLDEFRISKIARWITNFTPPTSPYTKDFEAIKDRLNLLHGYK